MGPAQSVWSWRDIGTLVNCVVRCDFELLFGGLTLVTEYDKKCIQTYIQTLQTVMLLSEQPAITCDSGLM